MQSTCNVDDQTVCIGASDTWQVTLPPASVVHTETSVLTSVKAVYVCKQVV